MMKYARFSAEGVTRMSLQFLVLSGPDAGRVFTLQVGPDLMLGRAQQVYYRLTDPRASRKHCRVILEADQVTILDNGSSSGTFINGTRVTRQVIKLGDVVRVGDSELRLQMGDFPLELAMANVQATSPPPASAIPQVQKLETLTGKKLGHYEIMQPIGAGRTGMVFFANDTRHGNRPTAIKVLHPEFSRNEDEMNRFVRAMKTMLPLEHANLVRLYGAGKVAGFYWVAMEFVAGENLTQVIQRIGVANMLDWQHSFRMAVHIGRALEYAHGRSIIHRGVTPTNILVEATTKTSKLGDLMLAKALEGTLAQQITRPGELIGEVEYMSPERTRGDTDLDERSDLYSLGATVYAMLTGQAPFEGKTLIERITKIRQKDPTKPTTFQASIPQPFESVVLKLLAKRPEDRYQSATALLRELGRIGRMHNVSV